jgi:hydrogenase maturation factor HypE
MENKRARIIRVKSNGAEPNGYIESLFITKDDDVDTLIDCAYSH